MEQEPCTHERTRFPERPVPDASYRCPDCGERVSLRGGRIWTVRELQDRLTRRSRVVDELATAARSLDLDELELRAPDALAALAPSPAGDKWCSVCGTFTNHLATSHPQPARSALSPESNPEGQ